MRPRPDVVALGRDCSHRHRKISRIRVERPAESNFRAKPFLTIEAQASNRPSPLDLTGDLRETAEAVARLATSTYLRER